MDKIVNRGEKRAYSSAFQGNVPEKLRDFRRGGNKRGEGRPSGNGAVA